MMPAPAACRRDDLRIERNVFGEPVRVFIGALDVTPLVASVQSNTTYTGTTTEVVLTAHSPRRAQPLETKGDSA